jgi:RNA polymerase sigma-70 factor (ECF subfamily)
MPKPPSTAGRSDAAGFAATRWTLVLAAAGGDDASRAADAMAELCRIYWYPLYAYIRRRGHPSHEAEDLTQEFFVRLLAKDDLAGVNRRKGKFRAFLLAALKHFLANQWDRSQAQKHGGGKVILSLDALSAESRYRLEPAHNLTPEKLFERQWALTVLERVLARLQAELGTADKSALFQGLRPFLTGGRPAASYAEAAVELDMSEGAVKVAVHRLRRRYRQLLKEEIAHTVASPEEIDDEIRYLLSCL